MSAPEPGPSERMNLTGFWGPGCAAAGSESASTARAAPMHASVFIVPVLLSLYSPRKRDDRNTQSWNARAGQDGRADGAASQRPGLWRLRLRPAGGRTARGRNAWRTGAWLRTRRRGGERAGD